LGVGVGLETQHRKIIFQKILKTEAQGRYRAVEPMIIMTMMMMTD
jgi:hypothetical protein